MTERKYILAGREIELEAMTGYIVKKAKELGVPVPINRGILDLIHDIEEGRRPQAWVNLDALAARVAHPATV